jgi:hypothetical protein
MSYAVFLSQVKRPLRIFWALAVVISATAVTTTDRWVTDVQARGFAAYGRGAYVRPYRPIDTVGRYRPADRRYRQVEHPGAVGYAAGRRSAYNTAAAVLPYLPNNCSVEDDNGTVYNCNGVYYRPYYQGTEVSYVPVSAPQ